MSTTSSTRTSSPIARFATLVGLGGLAVFGVSACGLSFALGTDGSGVPETVTYEFDDFDEVDISSTFEAQITIADGPPTIEVTVDDNLIEKLEVEVDDDELNVGFDGWDNIDTNVDPVVVITMPALAELDLSGASFAEVDGVGSSALSVNLSGASDATIDGSVDTLKVDGSGASHISFDGSADELTVELSGASSADLTSAEVGIATVDLSGSSNADFASLDELRGEMSGASTSAVPSGTTVSVSTSGASSVDFS